MIYHKCSTPYIYINSTIQPNSGERGYITI